MIASSNENRRFKALLLVVTAALTVGLFFRLQLLDGFHFLFGDTYDAVIELSILEHWYNVYRGLESWATTNYYFPHPHTLAYNDGYFLFGLPYSLFRAVGVDSFLASELVNISVKIIGFFTFYEAMHRIFKCSFAWSLIAAIIFTLANSTSVHSRHAQLFAVAFAPLMGLLIYNAIDAFRREDNSKLVVWGIAAGIFFSAWLLTAYYMAWFFAYLASVYLFVLASRRRAAMPHLWLQMRSRAVPLILIMAVTLLALVPFFWLYLPIAAETSGAHPASWTPSFLDILNIGDENFLFGSTWQWLNEHLRPDMLGHDTYELTTGIPPLLLGLFCAAAAFLWRHKDPNQSMVANLTLAVVISWLLTAHIIGLGYHRWSLWKFFHAIIPGATGIRTISRYQIFLSAPITAISVTWLSSRARNWPKAVLVLLAALLIAEEINSPRVALDRIFEEERLSSLRPPPSACRMFFALAPRANSNPISDADRLYSHNVDSMIIAELDHIPTLNGISTYNPTDWDFADTTRADYLTRVKSYATTHRLIGLCSLDLKNLQWSSF